MEYAPLVAQAGLGATREAARAAAVYVGIPDWLHAFGRVEALGKGNAPAIAVRQAVDALRIPCQVCGGPKHQGNCTDKKSGQILPAFTRRAAEWIRDGCPLTLEDGIRIPLPKQLIPKKKRRAVSVSTEAATS